MEDKWQVKTRGESLEKKCVDMHISQSSDSERCDSVELDDKIRILIKKNDTTESCKKPENNALNKDKNTLRKENSFLKQETTLTSTKKMFYEYEINRLNKRYHVEALDRKCNQEEMGMQIELLWEQIHIYEEDLKKERYERERFDEEKKLLQKLNEQSEFQLNKLKFQIKHFQTENQLLQKQVKQQAKDFQALTEKYFCLEQLFVPSCLNCGNCGLLQPLSEPQITLCSCAKRKQQQPL